MWIAPALAGTASDMSEVSRDTAFVPTERGAARALNRAPGFGRNEVIEGLGYLWLEVSDLSRSVAFYRDGLRFSVDGPSRNGPGTAHLRAGDLRLILSQRLETGPCDRRGVTITLEVAGVDAYHDALVARGLEPSPPNDDGALRSFTLDDPDGYNWRFTQSLT
jgi:uncharacterized glyoxalase superfamily protein PhnB